MRTDHLLPLLALVIASGHGQHTTKATFWSTQTDQGGCSMPQDNYVVLDALALGQSPELGELAYRPELCGQVLTITCGSGKPINAVVASTCNLGSPSCGVDLIKRTWDTATNNAAPGSTKCKVALAKVNPLPYRRPLCYVRTGSDKTLYYGSLGVYNTMGRLANSATLEGIKGTRANGAWFEFGANGKPLFTPDAKVVFSFEDGSKETFLYKNCIKSTSVKIWK